MGLSSGGFGLSFSPLRPYLSWLGSWLLHLSGDGKDSFNSVTYCDCFTAPGTRNLVQMNGTITKVDCVDISKNKKKFGVSLARVEVLVQSRGHQN